MADDIPQLGTPAGLPRAMLVGFLDAVPASAAILDSTAEIIAVNAAWRRFSLENSGQRDGWVGHNYLKVTDAAEEPDARAVAAGLRQVLAGERTEFQHDYPCHAPDGRERWFRCLISPLASGRPRMPLGGAVMHLDITAQMLAEKRAQAANRAKSDFLASLSHELRTPLNVVIGFSEMLMMGLWGPLGSERYVGYAGDILTAGKHLLSLINEVLDLSKVEAGRFELHDEPIIVPQVVRQSVALMAESAERSAITLVMEVDDGLPSLRGDLRILRQILLNLLSNATKFTPRGGLVTTMATVTPQGWMALSVSDTGIGIAAEDFERVLEPFGQVYSEQARLHSNQSTGLGLPLCRRFVELHGGELVLQSVVGKGTTVTALFPPERLGTV